MAAVATALCPLSLALGQAQELAPQIQTAPVASTAVVDFKGLATNELFAPPAEKTGAHRHQLPESAAPQSELSASAPAVTGHMSGGPAPIPTASFLGGVGFNLSGTQGAVGPEHLVLMLDNAVGIQNRSGQLVSSASLSGFWNSVAPVAGGATYDPRIQYDPIDNRWITVALDGGLLVGASQASDPTGGWYLERIDAEAGHQLDFPTLAFTRDWVAVVVNVWNSNPRQFVEARLYLFTKADLYANRPSAPRIFTTDYRSPARSYDAGASTLFLVNYSSGVAAVSTISGPVGAESFTRDYASFQSGSNAGLAQPAGVLPQPETSSTAANPSGIGDCVYRNKSVWCAVPVTLPAGSSDRQSIEWVQFDPETGVFYQAGRVDDPAGAASYAFPSIAVNADSDVLIGYSSFSAARYLSADFAFRYASDSAGVLRSDTVFKDGLAPAISSNSPHWGYYGATAPDPTDDRSFWTLQEYAELPSNGDTREGVWWAKVSPPAAVLTVDKEHSGSLLPGQAGAVYTDTVSNSSAGGPTIGMVTVTENVPTGLTLVSMTGTGWSCSANRCTRSDTLSPGANYPSITVTVNVAPSAPTSVTGHVSVSGGGAATASATDVMAIAGRRVAGVILRRLNPQASGNPCDVDNQGTVNVADVQYEIDEALGLEPALNDLNGDGVVNILDVQIVVNAALGLGCSATTTLTITTTSLPAATSGTAYSTTLAASGGVPPYTWSAAPLPAGLTITASTGVISGTPTTAGVTSVVLTVTDSTSKQASVTLSLTVGSSQGGSGVITVTNATVGQYLEVPITVTFSPAVPANTTMTLTSSNPAQVLIGSSTTAGSGSMQVINSLVTTTGFETYVQAVGAAGGSPVTITVSAPGYTSAQGTVTIANSGFVLSGPNGIAGAVSTYQGATTSLTVTASRLDSNSMFVEAEPIAPGLSFNVPLASSATSVGTVSPATAAFSGDVSTVAASFLASTTNTGTATVSITYPIAGFTQPALGSSIVLTVGGSGLGQLSDTTGVRPVVIGYNLQDDVTVTRVGNTSSTAVLTITSLNPSLLLFSTTPTGNCATSPCQVGTAPATATITVTFGANQSISPDFYAHVYGSSGSVQYSLSSPNYGTITSSITLAPSGLVLVNEEGGPVTSLTLPLNSSAFFYVETFCSNSSTNDPVQAVAWGITISAAVSVPASPSIGSISSSPLTLVAGSGNQLLTANQTSFFATAAGSTTITASATGYTSWNVSPVTVTNNAGSILFGDFNTTLGQGLETGSSLTLTVAAPTGGVQITLQSNSSLLQLATSGNGTNCNNPGPWSPSITVTVPAGSRYSPVYCVESLGSSGAPTYTASAPTGYYANTDTELTLAPSAIVFNPAPPSSVSLSGGPQQFTVDAVYLDGSGDVVAVGYMANPVTVLSTSSNPAAGTFSTVNFPVGAGSATGTFTPAQGGVGQSTTITLTQPTGFTVPNSTGQPAYAFATIAIQQ